MSEHHHHSHDHHEIPNLSSKQVRNAFYVGIALNLLFAIIEAGFGFWKNSLALLSDAGHNLSDVLSLVLALIAFKLMNSKATQNFTYGYKKTTVLVALINALILFFAVGGIIYEAVLRFQNPQKIEGTTVALVAFIGILINGGSAYLFMKGKEADLNVKGAYLHMVADALVSLGVVIAGIVMIYTDWFWLDSVMSIVIALVIFFGTWDLFKQSLKLSLDGVPHGIDFQKVKEHISSIDGVKGFKHIHIWALSTTENALTAHLQIDDHLTVREAEIIKEKVRHELEHFNIQHSTLEMYFSEKEFSEEELL